MTLDNILTKAKLTEIVEDLVRTEKLSYIDAVLHVCTERGIDPSDVGKLISPPIKAKIEVEGMASNLLPKSNSLNSFL